MEVEDYQIENGFGVREWRCCGLVWQMIVRPLWEAAMGPWSPHCPKCRLVGEDIGKCSLPIGNDFAF